jgi:hypothetical protein
MEMLRPNTATVAAKVIDGEAIIMNLSNGAYYSMDGSGALIWSLIEQGAAVGAIAERLARHYGLEPEAVHRDVERLTGELLAESLVVAEEAAGREAGQPAVLGEPAGPPPPYAAPVLNKYTEMADLLALDPPMPAIGQVPANPPD